MKMRLWGMTLALFALFLGACTEGAGSTTADDENNGRVAVEVGEPYPYSEPAPPEERTPLEGTFRRTITVHQAGGPPIYCQRCAPWRLDAGEGELRFDRGRLTGTFEPIAVQVDCRSEARGVECKHPPGFAVSAHYRVDGDRIEIFNDGNCIGMTGIYEWSVEDGALVLDVVEDSCPFVRLRAKYLTAAPWQVSG
jgi:hypothetical protein